MNEIGAQPIDLSKLCRICVEECANLVNLFDKWHNGWAPSQMLSVCIQKPVLKSDGRPMHICTQCIPQLEAAFEFCNLEKESDEKYRRLIESVVIKDEPVEVYGEPAIPMEFVANACDPSKAECKIEINCFPVVNVVDGEMLLIDNDREQNNLGQNQLKTLSNLNVDIKRKKGFQSKDKKRVRRKLPKQRQFECYKCKLQLQRFSKVRAHLNKHDAIERRKE